MRGMNKNTLSLKTHAKIRANLDYIKETIWKVVEDSSKSSPRSKRAVRSLNKIDLVRCLLDDAVFAEHWKSQADDKLTHVYYGTKDKK